MWRDRYEGLPGGPSGASFPDQTVCLGCNTPCRGRVHARLRHRYGIKRVIRCHDRGKTRVEQGQAIHVMACVHHRIGQRPERLPGPVGRNLCLESGRDLANIMQRHEQARLPTVQRQSPSAGPQNRHRHHIEHMRDKGMDGRARIAALIRRACLAP